MNAPNAAALVRLPTQRVGALLAPMPPIAARTRFSSSFFYVREMRPTSDNLPAALSFRSRTLEDDHVHGRPASQRIDNTLWLTVRGVFRATSGSNPQRKEIEIMNNLAAHKIAGIGRRLKRQARHFAICLNTHRI
jgi:hypothetical protein